MIVVNSRFLTQDITGVQRFAVELCLRLKALQPDIVFVAPHNIIQREIAKRLGVNEIGSHTGHLWEQWDLPRWCRKHGNPLLLNLCNTAPLMYSNKISTVHDVAFMVYPQTFSKSFLYAYRFLIPNIIKTSKKIITVSEFSKNEIVRFYKCPADKIDIIHNAVDDKFKPKPTPGAEGYILAVSSLNYRKNFQYILHAFGILKGTDKDVKLYIVGDLKHKSFGDVDLSEYLSDPQIKVLGRVSDEELVGLYSNAQCFVYPSLYEGFGIPPLEAQACGCPVICADASCLPEIFRDSVLYCDPTDPKSLVRKLKEVLKGENISKLQILGFENVGNYSWNKSAKKLLTIMHSLQG